MLRHQSASDPRHPILGGQTGADEFSFHFLGHRSEPGAAVLAFDLIRGEPPVLILASLRAPFPFPNGVSTRPDPLLAVMVQGISLLLNTALLGC